MTPIIAMTITLATVYAPIGFQGGLTGSLFLEFAMTLAVSVVLSGVVAITLSPVMSSRFVHPRGKEGRLTTFVNRRFEEARGIYARLLDAALTIRWGIVAVAFFIAIASWPLYHFSRQELAPVEDQNHISLFFEASPDSTVQATNRQHFQIVKAITAIPETDYTWALTTAWGGFGGVVAKDWHDRVRSTEEMYDDVYGAVRLQHEVLAQRHSPGEFHVALVSFGLQSGAALRRAIVGADASFYDMYPKDAKPDTSVPYVMFPGTQYQHLVAPVK